MLHRAGHGTYIGIHPQSRTRSNAAKAVGAVALVVSLSAFTAMHSVSALAQLGREEPSKANLEERLRLAKERYQVNNAITVRNLASVYVELGHFPEAREVLREWIAAGRPGDSPEVSRGLEPILKQVAISYQCRTLTLDSRSVSRDLAEWVRKQGRWDLIIPRDNDFFQCAVVLSGAKAHSETRDKGENRWWHIVPQDIEKPVVLRLYSKQIPVVLNLDVANTTDYPLPAEYRQYLGKTPGCDPTTPLVRALAADVKGHSVLETILNVRRWWDDHLEYGNAEGFCWTYGGDTWDAEVTLRNRMGVCAGMSNAACALLRANGLAARTIRGSGHSWPEVWVPRLGWVHFQNDWRLGVLRWPAFANEPWENPTDGRHAASVNPNLNVDTFWQSRERKVLLETVEDLPLEQVIRDSGETGEIISPPGAVKVSAPSAKPTQQALPVRTEGLAGVEFVLIPAGREGLREFEIGKYEVTVAQFRRFMEATGYKTTAEKQGWSFSFSGADKGGLVQVRSLNWQFGSSPDDAAKDNFPVAHVSQADAEAFAKWIDGRLPTDREWEHAARGGLMGNPYPWGDKFPPPQGTCNCADASAKRKYSGWFATDACDDGFADAAPVGSFQPNGYGLLDMAGNVQEWIAGRENGLRGGSFDGYFSHDPPGALRVDGPGWVNIPCYSSSGFRVARTLAK